MNEESNARIKLAADVENSFGAKHLGLAFRGRSIFLLRLWASRLILDKAKLREGRVSLVATQFSSVTLLERKCELRLYRWIQPCPSWWIKAVTGGLHHKAGPIRTLFSSLGARFVFLH